MSVNRPTLGAASLLLMAACTGLPFFNRESPSSQGAGANADAGSAIESLEAPPPTLLEVQDIQYDGLNLSGRVLLSPVSGMLRLDRRLLPTIHVNVGRVSSCTPGQPVTSVRADALAPLTRPEHLLLLEPGYWYGTEVRFRLFSEHFTGLGPECIEADLSVLSFDGRPVASKSIRARRPLPETSDGGMPENP